jgi:hypothetical protein
LGQRLMPEKRSVVVDCKSKPDAMDRFYGDCRFCFKVFAQFTDKYIHAPAQEKVILAPNVYQHFFSFDHFVLMFTKKPQQVGFLTGNIESFVRCCNF